MAGHASHDERYDLTSELREHRATVEAGKNMGGKLSLVESVDCAGGQWDFGECLVGCRMRNQPDN